MFEELGKILETLNQMLIQMLRSNENMEKYSKSKWIKFWENLKEGYDFFEKNGHNPPNVEVRNKHYVFG